MVVSFDILVYQMYLMALVGYILTALNFAVWELSFLTSTHTLRTETC